jgi:hypothetical protein
LAWPNGKFDAEEHYQGFPASRSVPWGATSRFGNGCHHHSTDAHEAPQPCIEVLSPFYANGFRS